MKSWHDQKPRMVKLRSKIGAWSNLWAWCPKWEYSRTRIYIYGVGWKYVSRSDIR